MATLEKFQTTLQIQLFVITLPVIDCGLLWLIRTLYRLGLYLEI